MSHEQQKTSKDQAADAWLEIQLEEELGVVRPPDLRHRVLASDPQRRAHAAQQVSATSNKSRWLAAAALLIGVATVFAVVQSSNRNDDKNETGTPPQDAQGEILVESLAEFQRHATTATNISISAGLAVSPSRRVLNEAARTNVPTAARGPILTELQVLQPLNPAGWVWPNTVRLELPNNRYITCAVYKTTEHRLGIRGLGDFQMTERLRATLAPLVDAVMLKTRLDAGYVRSRKDLLREGDASIPRDIQALTCSGLTDDDLKLLTRFPDLRELNLSRSRKTIDGPGLVHLLELHKLQKLDLRHFVVDEKYIAAIGPHPTLRELDLGNNNHVTGNCFAAFAKAASLQEVSLAYSLSITDEGLTALANLPSLTKLDLSRRSRGELTTAGLSQLGTMARLQTLVLSNLPGDIDEVVASLGSAPLLQSLDISGTQVTNVGLAGMAARRAAMPGKPTLPLRSLDASLCKQLQPGMLRPIGGFLNLQSLKMMRSSLATIDKDGAATLDTFEDLLRLHKLEKLELNGVRLDKNACKSISRLPSLKHLDISFTGDGINDAALQYLSEATNLEFLRLSGCDNFTDAGLISLRQLANLTHLDVNACDGFTIKGVDSFRSMRSDCELRLPDPFR